MAQWLARRIPVPKAACSTRANLMNIFVRRLSVTALSVAATSAPSKPLSCPMRRGNACSMRRRLHVLPSISNQSAQPVLEIVALVGVLCRGLRTPSSFCLKFLCFHGQDFHRSRDLEQRAVVQAGKGDCAACNFAREASPTLPVPTCIRHVFASRQPSSASFDGLDHFQPTQESPLGGL